MWLTGNCWTLKWDFTACHIHLSTWHSLTDGRGCCVKCPSVSNTLKPSIEEERNLSTTKPRLQTSTGGLWWQQNWITSFYFHKNEPKTLNSVISRCEWTSGWLCFCKGSEQLLTNSWSCFQCVDISPANMAWLKVWVIHAWAVNAIILFSCADRKPFRKPNQVLTRWTTSASLRDFFDVASSCDLHDGIIMWQEILVSTVGVWSSAGRCRRTILFKSCSDCSKS